MQRKTLVNILGLLVIFALLPIGMLLTQQQAVFKPRADSEPVVFSGPNVVTRNGQKMLTRPNVKVELNARNFPAPPSFSGGSSPSPSPSPSPSASAGISFQNIVKEAKAQTTPSCTFVAVNAGGALSDEITDNGGSVYSVISRSTGNRIRLRVTKSPTTAVADIDFDDLTSNREGGTLATSNPESFIVTIPTTTTAVTYTFTASLKDSVGAVLIDCASIQVNVNPPASSPSPSASPSAAASVCTDFTASADTGSFTGGVIRETIDGKISKVYSLTGDPSKSRIVSLEVARNITTADAALSVSPTVAFTPNVTTGTRISWDADIPRNSGTSKTDYIFTATVGSVSCQQPVVIRALPQTCEYDSTEVRYKQPNGSWLTTVPGAVKNQPFTLAGFHNGLALATAIPTDVDVRIVGPGGENAYSGDNGTAGVTFSPTQVGKYNILVTTKGRDVSQTNCKATAEINVANPAFYTRYYKIAETQEALRNIPDPGELYTGSPTIRDLTFSDTTPGPKFVWVQFIATDGTATSEKKVEERSATIILAEENPEILKLACDIDIATGGLNAKLEGSRFGLVKGSVKINGQAATLQDDEWSATDLTVKSTAVKADKSQQYKLELTRVDGQKVEKVCQVGVSILSLGTKVFCRDDGIPLTAQKQADITIAEGSEDGKVTKELVTIDSAGYIRGLKTKLQAGKRYKIGVKVPGSLRKVSGFETGDGTTTVPDFTLPLGDFNADGSINTLDYRLFIQSWSRQNSTGSAAAGSSDLNADGKVNSYDFACFRYDYNKLGEPEPTAGTVELPSDKKASPSPSGSVRPSASPSVVPSGSPSSVPSPSSSPPASPTP